MKGEIESFRHLRRLGGISGRLKNKVREVSYKWVNGKKISILAKVGKD